jgi:hypothetical protein
LKIAAADSVYVPPSAGFQEYIQDDPFMQISTTDNGYSSPNAVTFPLITPLQSTEDKSLPLELSEDIDGFHVRGHGRTSRSRTRAANPVEEPRKVDQNSKSQRLAGNVRVEALCLQFTVR